MQKHPHLKLCLVDMNNGMANQATRCFRRILEAFSARVRAANPGMDVTIRHVQPRNLGELPTSDMDLTLSSGGPGSPYEGIEDAWGLGFRKWVDSVVDANMKQGPGAPAGFMVCHSFQIVSHHLGLGTLQLRDRKKFGVMPVYTTPEGLKSPVLSDFGERLFAFEHRNWEVVDLNEKRLTELKGTLLARESRDGVAKGKGLVAFTFSPGLDGTQFHPEADREGILTWINRAEMAHAFKDEYGDYTYQQMLDTLNDPTRLPRTFGLLIPGWLTRQYNAMALVRGWKPVAAPVVDTSAFDEPKLAAG